MTMTMMMTMMMMMMMMMKMTMMMMITMVTMIMLKNINATPGEQPGREAGTVLELHAFQRKVLNLSNIIVIITIKMMITIKIIITINIITTIICAFQRKVLASSDIKKPSLISTVIVKNHKKSKLLLTTGKMISAPSSTADQ